MRPSFKAFYFNEGSFTRLAGLKINETCLLEEWCIWLLQEREAFQILANLWSGETLKNGLNSTDFKVCSIFEFWELWILRTSNFENFLFDATDIQKIEEAKIWRRQNLTLCYKWQIQTCSLSQCRSNMLSCWRFILASFLPLCMHIFLIFGTVPQASDAPNLLSWHIIRLLTHPSREARKWRRQSRHPGSIMYRQSLVKTLYKVCELKT